MYQPRKDGFSEAIALPWQFGNTSLPRDVTKSIFQYGRLVKSLNRTINGELPLFTQYLSTEKEKSIIDATVDAIVVDDDSSDGEYDDNDSLLFFQNILNPLKNSTQYNRDENYTSTINAADAALKKNDGSIAGHLGVLGNIQGQLSKFPNITDHLKPQFQRVYIREYNKIIQNPKLPSDGKKDKINNLNASYVDERPQLLETTPVTDLSSNPDDAILSEYNLDEREEYAIKHEDVLKLSFSPSTITKTKINKFFKNPDGGNVKLQEDQPYQQMKSQLSDALATHSKINHKPKMTELLYNFGAEFMSYTHIERFDRKRRHTEITFQKSINTLIDNWGEYYKNVYK